MIGRAHRALDPTRQIAVKEAAGQAHGFPFILERRFGLRAEAEREQSRCEQINHAASLKTSTDR